MVRYVIAISKAIEILIGDQVCDREQVGADHDKRSRPEECVPNHVLVWTTTSDCDRKNVGNTIGLAISKAIAIRGAIYIVIGDQDSVGYNGKIKNAPFNHETKKYPSQLENKEMPL